MELRHRILQINNSPKFELLKSEFRILGCQYQFNENGPLSSIEYTFSEHEIFTLDLISFVKSNDIMLQSARRKCYTIDGIFIILYQLVVN